MLRPLPALVACLLASRVEAQLLPTVIQNARIVTMSGTTLESGTVIIRGDRIAAIGVGLDVPFLSRRIDAAGGTVTPGLIDVHSSLGMTAGDARTGIPTARATDAFDRYATEHLDEALRNGVTTVYISSRGAPGIHGAGAVMRLVPETDGSVGNALSSESALEIDLGSHESPLARISTFDSVRKQFRDALTYRRDREFYEEDLEEYEKKLRERASRREEETQNEKQNEGAGKRRGAAAAAEDVPAPAKEPAKTDELKKPTEAPRDRKKELLLRALDRELMVRIEAHRSEDILNALDLQKELSLDLILVGATDAHLVAKEIASAGVQVVLEGRLASELHSDGPLARRSAEVGAVLDRAGVRWWVGSGARSASAARFVLASAQIVAAASAVEDPGARALELVTSHAARLLGAAGQIGRLAPDLKADLVVWSGDPLEPDATVRKVFVDGRLAYDAEVRP